MWKICAIALSSLLVAACAGESSNYTVGEGGFGPIRFGMTVAEAQAALGVQLKQDDYTDSDLCRYFFPVGKYADLAFMTANGRIVRVDVQPFDAAKGSATATDEGAKVGDSEAHVLQLYAGHIKVGPHFYTGPKGHYLRVYDARGKVHIIFETDGKKVEQYRAGQEPAVEYVEGCS